MKHSITLGVILGTVITVVLTLSSAKLVWDESMSLCPGIPYETTAVLSAGYPVRYNVSTVSAMGTCGVITSPLSFRDRMQALAYPLVVINGLIWSTIIIAVVFLAKKVSRLRS